MALRTTAVIPNWNGAGWLEPCLRSLQAQRGAQAEIVVVDNGSSDGSDRQAAALGARVIRLSENRGFAAAVNRGIAESDSEFVAVVNNDAVLDPDWLATLAAALDRLPQHGMVTGRVLMAGRTGLIDGAGDALSLGFAAARLGYGRPDGPEYQQERDVLAVSGAAALFRREVFRRAGNFEEAFFAYLEDVELCLRAQLAGFRARYIPGALAWHRGSASSVSQSRDPVLESRDRIPQGGTPGLSRRAGTRGSGSSSTDSRPSPSEPPLVTRHSSLVTAWMTAHQLLLAARYARGEMLLPALPRILVVQLLWAARLLFRGRALAWLRGLGIALRRWKRMTAWQFPSSADARRLLELLRASEAQIFRDRVPADRFWRIYFRLFPQCSNDSMTQ